MTNLSSHARTSLRRFAPPRLRLPIRLRTLLVVVLVVCLGLAAESYRRRAALFVEKALFHTHEKDRADHSLELATRLLKDWESMLAWSRSLGESNPQAEETVRHYRERIAQSTALSGHHAQLARKYDKAASWPLGFVEPDLPSPPDPYGWNADEWEEMRRTYRWLPGTPPQ